MQILFTVNQAAALKSGINAPSSTVRVEVDPAELTQEERDYLAAVLVDGYDATKRGMGPDGFAEYSSRALRIPRPDLSGVREAIQTSLRELSEAKQKEEKEAAERVAEKARAQASADAAINAAIATPEKKTIWVGLRDGHAVSGFEYDSGPKVSLIVPNIDVVQYNASDDAKERLSEARARIAAEVRILIAATEPELLRLEAKIQEAKAAQQAEYDALYARLPETLRRRDADGFASTDEVRKAIQTLIRADAGYGNHDGWYTSEELATLTDAQYERLLVVKATSPEGSIVTPSRVWDVRYRPARDDEEGDADGEVDEESNERFLAVIEWSRGGLPTKAVVSLEDNHKWLGLSTWYEDGSLTEQGARAATAAGMNVDVDPSGNVFAWMK